MNFMDYHWKSRLSLKANKGLGTYTQTMVDNNGMVLAQVRLVAHGQRAGLCIHDNRERHNFICFDIQTAQKEAQIYFSVN